MLVDVVRGWLMLREAGRCCARLVDVAQSVCEGW
jgi:hypothetical protein